MAPQSALAGSSRVGNERGALVACHEDLVDLVVVDVDHLEGVARPDDLVGPLGDLAQHVHHEARDRLVGRVLGELVDVERMLEVVDRRGAVDKPRAVLTLDDLEFVSVDDELAHHGAHHVVDRDDADDQGVLVENDGEVGAGALEDVEHFGKRQAVRNEGAGLDDAGLL